MLKYRVNSPVPSLSRSEMFRHRRDEDKKNISNRIVYLKGHVEEVTEVLRWAKIANRSGELKNLVRTDKKINIDVASSCTNERTDILTKRRSFLYIARSFASKNGLCTYGLGLKETAYHRAINKKRLNYTQISIIG